MAELVYTTLDPDRIVEAHRFEHATFNTVATEDLYTVEEMENVARTFPEGNFMVLDGDRIIGLGMGILVEFDFEDFDHSLPEISGQGGIENHHPDHPWYYGTTIAVDPAYRGQGIGTKLYALRKGCVRKLNKKGIVAGGVLPGYANHRDTMSAEDYIAKVSAGELYDPTLTFQISEGFRAVAALPNYMRDSTVDNYAVLIVWDNPNYRESAGG